MIKKALFGTLTLIALSQTTLHAQEHGLYVGMGYANTDIDLSANNIEVGELSTDSILLLAGYDMNEYFGIEGRYYLNASDAGYALTVGNTKVTADYKAESFALYAKPQYNFMMLNLYALLGFTSNDYSASSVLGGDTDDTLFSWGAGVKINLTQNIGAFVDYTNLGESDSALTDTDLSSWNIGFSYKF